MSHNNIAMRALPAEIAAVFASSKDRAKIAVVGNRKGGTGKTTICTFIAEGLALLAGKRVLLIDTDRQCNLSNTFGLSEQISGEVPHAFSASGTRPDELLEPPIHPDYEEGDPFAPRSSSAEVMLEKGLPVIPYATYIDGAVDYMRPLNPLGGRVDVLPGDGQKLLHIHSHADTYTPRGLYVKWAEWLVNSNVLSDYDMVIFDTPPMDTALHEALYQLADHTIVPVQATNDTLSAATAIAFSCMAAQAADQRPRTMTTMVNPPQSNRLTNKENDWLTATVWSNQFLGPMPPGLEFPRARAVHDRRDAPMPPHNEAYMASLSPEDRKLAEQASLRFARELSVWHRPTNPTRQRLYDVIAFLNKKLLGSDMPADPWARGGKDSDNDTDADAAEALAETA